MSDCIYAAECRCAGSCAWDESLALQAQYEARKVVPEPYYEDGTATLYHGDALELLRRFPADAFEITITDPPYNAGKKYGDGTDDRRPWPEWVAWCDEWIAECLRVSRDGLFCFLSQTAMQHYIRHGTHEIAWFACWVKPLSMAICAAPFMPHWEPIAYFGDKRRRKGDGEGWGGDVLTHNVEYGKTRWGHPTPKPLALMRDLTARFQGPILDPFAGSGTTLRAAKDNNVCSVGIEINQDYCATIARRLELGIPVPDNQGVLPL